MPFLRRFTGNFVDPWVWLLVKTVLLPIASSKLYHSNVSIFSFITEGAWWKLDNIYWIYEAYIAIFALVTSKVYLATLTFIFVYLRSVSEVYLVYFDPCIYKHYFLMVSYLNLIPIFTIVNYINWPNYQIPLPFSLSGNLLTYIH